MSTYNGFISSLRLNLSILLNIVVLFTAPVLSEELSQEVCRGTLPHYQNTRQAEMPNPYIDYGVFVQSNNQISPSYYFKVYPSLYFSLDTYSPVRALRTYVYKKVNPNDPDDQGKLICELEGGPMLRSSYAPTDTDPNDLRNASKGFIPMKMSFDLRSRNYFRRSVNNAGPHIPVVLLGRMGETAAEGIGSIFGNLSTYKIDPAQDPEAARTCSAPHNNTPGNFAMIESFRNNRVCVFGKETASDAQLKDTMTDQDQDPNKKYHIEIIATPKLDPATSAIHNHIYYKVLDPQGILVVEKNWLDTEPVVRQNGGWLIFAVIGKVKPWSFEIWIDNLKVEY